jgi:HAD superfamily hydrolase (TIGR01490 family)
MTGIDGLAKQWYHPYDRWDEGMIAAFFDLDGTLYTGHIWQDLVSHHRAAGRNRRWVVAYVAWNMLPFPLYKLGLLSQDEYFRAWGETMGWLVRRWSVQEAGSLFATLTEERILPNLRREVLDLIRRHRAEGHLVALVSGTFAPLLAEIAGRIAVEHAIGTPLEVQDGRYTGRIVPPLCQGKGKAQRVQTYLAGQGLTVDWAASYAYADRETDRHLLGRVGHPTAVHPDERLANYARTRGWPIIEGEGS